MKVFNGTSIMWMAQKEEVNILLASDACLTGLGAKCEHSYFHAKFPDYITCRKDVNIAHLEMWAILVLIRLWKAHIKGIRFVIGCDNQSVLNVVNGGYAHDALLQTLLRELMFEVATAQAEIVIRYVPSKLNVIPDLLSRWHLDNGKHKQKFLEICQDDWKEEHVTDQMFKLKFDW